MDVQNTNDSLRKLYEPQIDSLLRLINEDKKLSDPLLLSVDERYILARTKIMVIGQETHKWEWHEKDGVKDPGWPITLSSPEYVSILMERYHRKHWGKIFNPSPFWKAADLIYEKLNDYQGRPDIGYLWNNIDKVDSNGGALSEKSRKQLWNCFFVLKEELEITKPDVVIFFVGQRYDALMEKQGFKISPLPDDMQKDFEWLAKIESEGVLPENSFILAHPKQLQLQNRNDLIGTAIDLIKQGKTF